MTAEQRTGGYLVFEGCFFSARCFSVFDENPVELRDRGCVYCPQKQAISYCGGLEHCDVGLSHTLQRIKIVTKFER